MYSILEINAIQKQRVEKSKGDPKNIVGEGMCDFK